ncbi:hypothetical protein GCM10008904_27540 [Paraclostridium ghonii]|uniref:ABC transporter permease n=1 Tax=Paraclostridium ghonii TaxID=29358 RepID=A0ABU0MY20_9FIRM|nr:hypothetical protein [Paeniclostridium ghonii]MDQ0555809.1 hypothetical protein [Paeniclostridium ghonii]
MNKTSDMIENLKFDNLSNEEFEDILDEELVDIENFLDSYIVKKADEEKIDFTIDKLRIYMPQNKNEEVISIKKASVINKVKINIDLLKMQFKIFNKMYLFLSIIIIFCGLVGAIRFKLNPYMCAYTISPIPILLGLVETLRGKDENVWELELSYKYSFREIMLSKLVIVGITSIVISLLISLVLAGTYSEVNLFKIINICLIPSCFISFISLILASIYRSMNSITLSTSIWIIGCNIVDKNTIKNIVNINNYKLFTIFLLLCIFTILASKIFYKKSVNFIDYKNLDF